MDDKGNGFMSNLKNRLFTRLNIKKETPSAFFVASLEMAETMSKIKWENRRSQNINAYEERKIMGRKSSQPELHKRAYQDSARLIA